jgi:hypothetical protein
MHNKSDIKECVMNYGKIHQEFYEAFLKAAEMTGESYRNLSWFGRNKAKLAASAQDKKAA